MKIKSITVSNIGKIKDETIILNKALILLYGEILQGKSTLLNSVRWACGGEFPPDIIRHGQDEARVELAFDGGTIERTWYRGKEGTKTVTKARPITFVIDGKPVKSPVSELKRFLNPFLLDQDFLRKKNDVDRKAFFTELFGVDTKDLDIENFNKGQEASKLRGKISGYGIIDLVEVKRVDVTDLQAKLSEVRSNYSSKKSTLETELQNLTNGWEAACENVDAENDKIRSSNNDVIRHNTQRQDILDAIESHKAQIKRLEAQVAEMPVKTEAALLLKPAAPDRTDIQKRLLAIVPDTTELERQISEAGATNVRAEQYEKNLERHKQLKADEEALAALEKRQREIRVEKRAKLKTVTDTCGIAGLEFDDEGEFKYDATTSDMLSDSQIIKLSAELSNLYPAGLGISCLDRAESLGKSIFDYVDLAKKNNSTILATIVGEKPAKVPEDVGVFVVVEGELQS